MKRIYGRGAILAAIALSLAAVSCSSGDGDDGAAATAKALDGFENVYTVEYTGNYKLDSLVAADLTTEDALIDYLKKNTPEWKAAAESGVPMTISVEGAGCSSIAATNAGSAGGKIFGRNFDYKDGTAILLHTKPSSGYESISTSYPYFLTGHRNWAPSGGADDNAVALGAIFVPMDGMNEKGLYVSVLEAGDSEQTAQSADGKHHVQTTVAVRYILDKAASVDEAKNLLEGVNMHSVHNKAYHLAIADSTGKAVVVEWISNVMHVSDAKVVTNHYLTADSGKPAPADTDNSLTRYNAVNSAGTAANWSMTPEQVRDALSAAKASPYHSSSTKTLWSAVYEPSAKRITYYFREDFTKPAVVKF